jgi:hypothetical protein
MKLSGQLSECAQAVKSLIHPKASFEVKRPLIKTFER